MAALLPYFKKLSDHFLGDCPEQFQNWDILLSTNHQYMKISNSLQTLHNLPSSPVYALERIRNIFGKKCQSYLEFQNFNKITQNKSPADQFLNYMLSTTNVRNVLKNHLCKVLKLQKNEEYCFFFLFSVMAEFIFRLLIEVFFKIIKELPCRI